MQLSRNIRTVIQQEGISILSEEKFANILNDMQSFKDDIVLLNIFKDLIKKGFISKIPSVKNDSDKDSLVKNIKSKTGYDSDIITKIVDAVLIGLDKKIDKDTNTSSSAQNTPPLKRKKKNWLIWLFALGAVLIVGGFLLFSSSKQILYRIYENGKYGFIDSIGNVKIPPQYKYVSEFTKDGCALVISSMDSTNNKISIKYGYINTQNKLIVDTINQISYKKDTFLGYYHLNPDSLITKFNNGTLGFRASLLNELLLICDRFIYQDSTNHNKLGYKNSKNEVIIPARFMYCKPFVENVAFVLDSIDINSLDEQINEENFTKLVNSFSLIDANGNYIADHEYAWVQDFTKGKTWVKKGVLKKDENGDIITSADLIQIDKTGKTLIGPIPCAQKSIIYNSKDGDLYLYLIDYFFNGDFIVYTYINNEGKIAPTNSNPNIISLDSTFQEATIFSQGYAAIRVFENNKNKTPRWAFVDKHFNFPNEEYFDSVQIFTNGLCPVKQAIELKDFGKWGFLDLNFQKAIDYKFDDVGIFRRSLAYAKISGSVVDREGYINKQGVFVWSTENPKKK